MDVPATTIKTVFFTMSVFIATSMILKIAKGTKAQCKSLLMIQLVYYFVYFALVIPDMIASVYFNPFWRLRGFSKDVISTIYICYQTASIFGSVFCTPTLKTLGTRFTLILCCIMKFLAVLVILISPNPIYAYTSRVLWGFSYMLTKISLDNWFVGLTVTYNISLNDRGILLNYRMIFQFIIDLITTNQISTFVQQKGLVPTFSTLVYYYAFITVPIMLTISYLSGKGNDQETNKDDKKMNLLVIPIQTFTTVIRDTFYTFAMGFFKSLLASNFKNQNLPFSVIMSTYNAMGTLGTIIASFLLEYVTQRSLFRVIFITFTIIFFVAFVLHENDLVMYIVTLSLGFLDGLITPIMITMRKENVPSEYRVQCLSLVRVMSSILGFVVTFIMKYTFRTIYLFLTSGLFAVILFLPYYVKYIHIAFNFLVSHFVEPVSDSKKND